MLKLVDDAAIAAAIASGLDPDLHRTIAARRAQLLQDTGGDYDISDLAHWIVVAPGDGLPAIEPELGVSLYPDPPWEWVLHHGSHFEAAIVIDDSGFGSVLLVPDAQGVDHDLLKLLRMHAQRANPPKKASSG